MNKIKAVVSFMLILSLLLTTCGCSFRFTSFDNLIRPPKLSGKYQDLQDSFEKSVSGDISLVTPENGSYQSAFIIADLDGDRDEEGMAFYIDKHEPDIAKFSYFEYKDNNWIYITTLDGPGDSIDKVELSDINLDGYYEIIVGWKLFSSVTNKAFTAYSIDTGIPKSIASHPYTYLALIDVNGDGLNDILTTAIDSSVPNILTATAKFYNYNIQKTALTVMGEAPLDGNVVSYSSVSSEFVDDTNLIYIEAEKGQGESLTEIIYWDDINNILVSPLFDSSTQSTTSTWRNVRLRAYDIDADGYLEIPTSVEMPASASLTNLDQNTSVEKPVYYIKWVKFRNERLKPVQYSIYNDDFGYILNIKSSWVGRITVNGVDGQWDFYRYNASGATTDSLLFSIYGYNSNDSDMKSQFTGYNELASATGKNFVYNITDAGYNFGIKDTLIESDFKLSDFGGAK